jgi:hypothetical protein
MVYRESEIFKDEIKNIRCGFGINPKSSLPIPLFQKRGGWVVFSEIAESLSKYNPIRKPQ